MDIKLYAFVSICGLLLSGCNEFLDEKSDRQLVTATTLPAMQALLDHTQDINMSFASGGEASADEYYLSPDFYKTLPEYVQRLYRWEPDHVFATSSSDWHYAYKAIYASNAVLQGLENIPRTAGNATEHDFIKGQALALRAFRFLDASWVWCNAYDVATASTDLGLPLRLDPDFNLPSERATLEETYSQIFADLEASVPLLPDRSINAFRVTKPMAYALLARAHLSMRNYDEAGAYADTSLTYVNELIDFNDLDETARFPIERLNKEVIFFATSTFSNLYYTDILIPDERYRLYSVGDLRRTIFFNKEYEDAPAIFKGFYDGAFAFVNGPTTSEMLLTRAECAARANRISSALEDLNLLRRHRWQSASFSPIEQIDADNLLDTILDERKRELILRGLRWMDLKRLNKEGRQTQLEREVEEQLYTLPPNDLRYTLPIPEQVIEMSGMQQNPR